MKNNDDHDPLAIAALDDKVLQRLREEYDDEIPPEVIQKLTCDDLNAKIDVWRHKCFETVVMPGVRHDIRKKLKRFGAKADLAPYGIDLAKMVERVENTASKSLLVLPNENEPLKFGKQERSMHYDGTFVSLLSIEISTHNPIIISYDIVNPLWWPNKREAEHLRPFFEYLVNVGGELRVDSFDEDWIPVGPVIRMRLDDLGFVKHGSRRVAATEEGREFFQQCPGQTQL